MSVSGGYPILVIGCGIIGLSSSLVLKRLGFHVTIWAKDLPPNTTSNKAGAIWEPFWAAPEEKILKWSRQSLDYYINYLLPDPDSGMPLVI
jgi:D-amino-acid oxidase